jgi:prevent-host-death family protein
MSSVWALQDAKSKFSAVINRACEVEPQIVTRRGSPVVVMMSYGDYKKLSPCARSAVDVLLGGPKVDGGFEVTRDRSPAREVAFQ